LAPAISRRHGISGRERYDAITVCEKKAVSTYKKSVRPFHGRINEGPLDPIQVACIQEFQLHPERARCSLHLLCFGLSKYRVCRIAEIGNGAHSGYQYEQQFKPLRGDFGQKKIDACKIASRTIESVDQADLDRVGALHKNDRDRLSRLLGGKSSKCTLQRNNHGYLPLDQIGDQNRKAVVVALG
jgi:hypothetical protein